MRRPPTGAQTKRMMGWMVLLGFASASVLRGLPPFSTIGKALILPLAVVLILDLLLEGR